MASPEPSPTTYGSIAIDQAPVEDEIQLSDPVTIEPTPKLKGRQRVLQSLHRISSSPALVQLGRKRATSNPYVSRSTLSSQSLLNSTITQSTSNAPSTFAGGVTISTASAPGTPGLDTPFFDGSRLPIRHGGSEWMTATPPSSEATPGSLRFHSSIPELVEDYFSRHIVKSEPMRSNNFKFWDEVPHELKLSIFSYLTPKELIRTAIVSKDFYRTCYDGQLWTCFDASEFYTDIPAESLAKIIVAAGPFIKDLNLRGCVQVEHYKRAEAVVKACKNLINATLEGCRNFQRSTLHTLLTSNERLAHLNLTGLVAVNNGSCKIIAKSCPQLEFFNVSWCTHMDSRGIRMVLAGCPKLRDLRAGEVRGFSGQSGLEVAQAIFETNNLERLVLSGCGDLTDASLEAMIHGVDPEVDVLEDRPLVPARKLRHLDLTRCSRLTNQGVKALAHNVPYLEALQLSGCATITDDPLMKILATTPRLTHLDLEELSELTNPLLSEHLAKAPCAHRLEHLSISYCEKLGDVGVLPVIRECTNLRTIDMDNTRISDLVLAEAASMVRTRSRLSTLASSRPQISLRIVAYDCSNVTWTGIREVLSRNAEIKKPRSTGSGPTYPTEIISLKCFYGFQMTVDEHTKRVLKGDLAAAARLERKWAEYMIANEEAGAVGAGLRRRRRRAREAALLHADEEEGNADMGGIGRRRRARSGGCMVM